MTTAIFAWARGAAVAGAAALAASASFADTWDMPVPYGDANFHTQNHVKFAEEVTAATDGALSITVHSSGSLFKHPEIKGAVRAGQAPIGEFFMGLIANDSPLFGADNLPFLATGYEDAKKLWDAQKALIEAELDKEGLMALYAVPWPPQGLYVNGEATDPAALAGLKFRAYNASTQRLAQLLGMEPTQIEVPDLPQAFSTGRVQAMITSPSTGFNSKAWDYLSNYYDVKAWVPKNIVVVNKRAFNRLSAEVQAAVLAAAAAAETRGWEASITEATEKTQGLSDNGIAVAPPSDALLAALKEAGETMAAEWKASAGADGETLLKSYAE